MLSAGIRVAHRDLVKTGSARCLECVVESSVFA